MVKTIPVAEPWIDEEEVQRVAAVVRSGWIARGKEIKLFEQRVAEYLGAQDAVAVSSGTAALEVALRALRLEGKEIITTVASCVPTLNAILHAGCKPVFVDVDSRTYNIDTQQIEQRITAGTGAVLPVHLHGHPCDMDMLSAIAREYGLPLIEDCAIAMGAKYKEQEVGTFGAAGCFSFYANKMITTAEGGMVVTNDPEVAERARIIRDHGQHPEKPFYHVLYGYNFKLSNVHAAIGLAQMDKLQRSIKRRRDNAACLTTLLQEVEALQLPQEIERAYHVYFSYPILLKEAGIRDRLCAFLADQGIESRPMFGPMTRQPFFEDLFGVYPERFPVAERIGLNGFYVSCSPLLEKENVEYIASKIQEGLNEH